MGVQSSCPDMTSFLYISKLDSTWMRSRSTSSRPDSRVGMSSSSQLCSERRASSLWRPRSSRVGARSSPAAPSRFFSASSPALTTFSFTPPLTSATSPAGIPQGGISLTAGSWKVSSHVATPASYSSCWLGGAAIPVVAAPSKIGASSCTPPARVYRRRMGGSCSATARSPTTAGTLWVGWLGRRSCEHSHSTYATCVACTPSSAADTAEPGADDAAFLSGRAFRMRANSLLACDCVNQSLRCSSLRNKV
mmetsp:Transcript_19153/g.57842  ORF Transcript_19153/g.57842 Transcript_19153/m.57842 type:complete len:250 (-) Transcript_19153:657-1406(-)